ncbi:hypothetical protein [Microcoleus sp. herbarium14]|uniref:hypothetical protein n=1 Tax=Microcoleus sp. herbarium14 TaxID=3055439 RepID=UPI002FD0AF75
MKSKKKITQHIHGRIKNLAVAAIDRGDIESCERISDDIYLIKRSSDLTPTTYTAVGAGTLLYLLNSLAQAQAE